MSGKYIFFMYLNKFNYLMNLLYQKKIYLIEYKNDNLLLTNLKKDINLVFSNNHINLSNNKKLYKINFKKKKIICFIL